MKPNERKLFIFLMHMCQKPTVITIGGYYELNMNTCLAVRCLVYLTMQNTLNCIFVSDFENDFLLFYVNLYFAEGLIVE